MDETRNANVNLTADVSQYNQQVGQSVKQTNLLTDSVNKLVSSLDGITKRAGKKLLLFSAADAAAMLAYTAAAAKYEKQLTTLRAQTELSGKSLSLYKKGIEETSRQMPVLGAAVTALVTQINQLGVTSEKQATQMARTFVRLSAATGEDISALTSGLIELSRQMGTLGNGAAGVEHFADSLTTVSNSAGVSATAVLQFSQAIAPMARAAGIGQKEVLGISTAFTKAGADGFAAANTFNSMVSDITRQVQSGSPEIGKYAAAIGLTVEQFKQLDSTERIVQIFEAVSKAGPDASKVIDRLGYDGIRAAKSIQAVANESGGLRKAIQESVGAYASGSTARGAEAAFDSLDSQMTKFRNNIEQIAATIGSTLLPVATKFMEIINATLDAVNRLAGPLLQIAGAIGGIVAPLAAAFGGLLTMMGPLSTLMIAMTAFRLSPIRAAFQGVKEGAAAKSLGPAYVPTTSAGQLAAKGQLPIFRQAPYALGQSIGSRLPLAAPGPNRLGQLALGGGIMAADKTRMWYVDGTKQMIANAAMRDPMMRVSMTGNALDAAWKRSQTMGGTLATAFSHPAAYLMSRGGPVAPPTSPLTTAPLQTPQQAMATALRGGATPAQALAAANAARALQNVTTAGGASAAATKAATAATVAQTRTVGDLTKSLGKLGRSAAGLPIAYGMMGGRLAGQGAMAAGKGLFGAAGSMIGLSAGPTAAIAAALGIGLATKSAMESTQSTFDPMRARGITSTNEALGIATEPVKDFSTAVQEATAALRDLTTAKSGFNLTGAERTAAEAGEYTDSRFADLRGPEQIKAYIASMGPLSGEQSRSLGMDAWKRLSELDQASVKTYDQTVGGAGTDYAYQGVQTSLLAGARATQQDTWGNAVATHISGALFGPLAGTVIPMAGSPWADNGMKEQVNAAVGAMQTEYGDTMAKSGNKPAGQALAARIMEAADEVFKDNSDVGKVLQQNFLASIEEAFLGGADLGVGTSASGQMALSGVDLTGGAALAKALRESESGSSAQTLNRMMFGADTSSTANAQAALERIMASKPLSDYEKQVQSTTFGKFARNDAAVLAASTGAGTGSPAAQDTAVENMIRFFSADGDFSGATKEVQAFKKNITDLTDPTYMLAVAAGQAAERLGQIQGRREGGFSGEFAARYQQLQDKIQNPDTRLAGESADSLRQQQEGMDQDLINKKIEAYNVVKSYNISFARQEKAFQVSVENSMADFQLSMLRSQEDFAISMRRASEDAAESIYDPFQRVFATGTMGSDSIVGNLKDQNRKIQEQMENLKKLKDLGLSQQAIDMLQLTDPSKAYQVQRLMDEGGGNITGINSEVAKRGKLAKASTQNPMVQEYRRTIEDRDRMVARSVESFDIGMGRMQKSLRVAQRQALWDLNQYGKDLTLAEQDIDKMLTDQVNTALDSARDSVRAAVDGDVLYIKTVLDGMASAAAAASTVASYGDDHRSSSGSSGTPGVGATTKGSDTSGSHSAGWQNAWMGGDGNWYAQTKGTKKGKPINLSNMVPAWNQWAATGDVAGMQQWWESNISVPGYAAGGVVKGMQLAMLGEKSSHEVVIPLSGGEGRAAMAQITDSMVKSLHTSKHSVAGVFKGGSTHIVNNNNEFRDIQVVAQDPNQMARALKLEAKKRNMRTGASG